ncbi:MAG TPA: metallophosphoesterase [Planctomycetota bacterium]|nr:metallophosphoesterase [Planctomycetota bacterium]
MIDILAHGFFLAADAAFLFLLRKRPKPVVFAGLLAAGGMVAVLTSPFLGGGLFGAMRVLAWAIFVHGVIVLAGGAIVLWKPCRKVAIPSAIAALLTAAVGIDAFFIEPHWLEVTRYRIVSAKVKRPLKIAVIADIQTDVIGDYERRALKAAADEKADIVLFAGDYIQEHDDARRRELNRELRAILKDCGFKGAVAVEGNCDYEGWPDIFEGTEVTWTRETRTINEADVQITALSLTESEYSLPLKPTERFHIVVGHRPDFALGDVQADLLVAGHTHGGQVRLPGIGPLITLSRVPRSWAAGLTELPGGRTLIVSRGVGMERGPAPRLRFLCRPELVIVDLVPSK